MESLQLMNQLLTQLIIDSSLAEIHPSPFAGAAAENVLDWLESFKENATHNLWDDQEKLQVIPVYLNNTNLNFYCFLPEEIKGNIELLEAVLWDLYHTQDSLYNMRVKRHELKQESLPNEYINDFDNLSRRLQLPEQQNYIIKF